jgi:molecular chaperone DnaJ
MPKDYYKILGVDKSTPKDGIKKAFHSLAHKYHPDKKGGDEAKFKEVNEAYGVLSDDKKRAEYDTYGQVGGGMGGGQSGAGGFGGFDFSQFTNANGGQGFDFGDIFSDFFGGGRGAQAQRGRDISIDIELTFEEAIFGVERKILLNKTSVCQVCHGTGGAPNTEFTSCKTCNGKGKIREVRSTILGSFSTDRTCETCKGKGKVPKDKCKECHGAGIAKREHEISVKIPAGIENGEMIRLTGMGEAIAQGVAGDLYIKIHVRNHTTFRKQGHDLVMDLKIKLSEALLGGERTIKTLDGDIALKIPERVPFGEILRVKNKGVPNERGKRGDILIRIFIELPNKLSKESKKLIEELKKEGI